MDQVHKLPISSSTDTKFRYPFCKTTHVPVIQMGALILND